jgi:DNA-binding response OmpR family regulator
VEAAQPLESRHRAHLLEGEDPDTDLPSEAKHWMVIYLERQAIWQERLARARADLPGRVPELERELARIQEGLRYWRTRHWSLAGLDFDRPARTLAYGGRSVRLTRREADLLEVLLAHPHQRFSGAMLVARAWPGTGLSEEQMRNYVVRLRRKLAELGAPCRIDNGRRQGYALVRQ